MAGVSGGQSPFTHQEEPRQRRPDEHLEVLPLAEIGKDISPGCSWDIEACLGHPSSRVTVGFVVATGLALHVGSDVGIGLFDVVLDVKGVSWRLGNGDAVVQREAGRDGAHTDDNAPGPVGSYSAGCVALRLVLDVDVRVLEGDGGNEGNHGRHEQAKALHGEDGSDHGATPASRGKSAARQDQVARRDSVQLTPK